MTYPGSDWRQFTPPMPPPRKRRTGLAITLISAFVIVAIAIVVLVMRTDQPLASSGNSAEKSATKTVRPADPAKEDKQHVLKQSVETKTVNYGSLAAIDACAMMPLTLLESNGVKPYPWANMIQRGIREMVTAERATVKNATNGISSCMYIVPSTDRSVDDATEGNHGYVSLDIDQAPYNYDWEMELRKFDDESQRASSGLSVYYKHKQAGEFNARISGTRSFAARLHASKLSPEYKGVTAQAFFDKITDAVVANLVKGPNQQARFSYAAPYDNVPNACDVLSPEVFAQATGASDSGYVEETAADSETYTEEFDETISFSIVQECKRYTPDRIKDQSVGKTMTVRLETYRDEESAKHADINQCDPKAPTSSMTKPVKVDEKVGDGAVCVSVVGSPEYHFRVGRTAVSIMGNTTWMGTDQAKVGQLYTPAAKQLADKLRK